MIVADRECEDVVGRDKPELKGDLSKLYEVGERLNGLPYRDLTEVEIADVYVYNSLRYGVNHARTGLIRDELRGRTSVDERVRCIIDTPYAR
mgnify:CR=1 FL=1